MKIAESKSYAEEVRKIFWKTNMKGTLLTGTKRQ